MIAIFWGYFIANSIPGVIYGVDDDRNVLKHMVTVDKKLLAKELRERGRSFENTLYEIVLETETGNTSYVVVPRQTQFCPCK
jgi:ribosomal protein L25 (general stress protein Ctc)